jgi:hypothetical protein
MPLLLRMEQICEDVRSQKHRRNWRDIVSPSPPTPHICILIDGGIQDAFVLQLTKVLNLSNPERRDFESLKEWLASEEYGNHFLAKAGVEAKAWDADSFGDLMALKCQNDRFAQRIINAVIPTYHRRIGYWFHNKIEKDNLGDLWHYKHEPFIVLGNVMCTLLSSLLPSCCIFALYYVKAMLARLILITCFSLAFSFVMTFLIQARRQDVFATTTALAAVQVVFVGSVSVINIGGNKT